VLAKQDPTRFVPVRIDDVPVPQILGPVLAPALFGLQASDARAELLRAVQGPTRPDQEPPFPGLVPDPLSGGPFRAENGVGCPLTSLLLDPGEVVH
jgi:hypothetical protein